jgi:hypothetical protein
MSRLEDAVAVIGEFVDTFDADLIDGDRAARLVEVFTQGARFCEAGRLAAAARVEHTHAWKREGHRNAREWYQAKTKTSATDATRSLETGKHLQHQPHLNKSLRSGKISADQADEIASAAHADPTSEHELVGHTNPGEICEIEGIGPVPVQTVRAAASDAILIKNGQVIATTPAARTIPAHLRRTLTERDRTCVIPGCDNQHHLEIHHLKPYAEGGTTTEDNTARICPYHHDQITYADATLTGPPRHWKWTPPPRPPPPPGPGPGPGPAAQTTPALGNNPPTKTNNSPSNNPESPRVPPLTTHPSNTNPPPAP